MLSKLASMGRLSVRGKAREPARDIGRDVRWLLAGLVAVVAWDAAGLDLAVSRLFADGHGFAWRDQWLFSTVLHDGARGLAWVVAAVLIVNVWQPLPFARGLDRIDRARWLGATLACVIVIPVLKQASLTSCPWSLAEFGGTAVAVSHWLPGRPDGGAGHCFPAGHPVAAFCFLPGYFVLRRTEPVVARRWLAATVAAGIVLGAAQLVRGAHFVSHSLWTGWLCWALGLAVVHGTQRRVPA